MKAGTSASGGGSEVTVRQWGWQSGRKTGCEAGKKSKDKLETMRSNENLHLALTISKLHSPFDLKKLVPFAMELHVHRTQNSEKLKEET